jgi:glc operon protein GlcG
MRRPRSVPASRRDGANSHFAPKCGKIAPPPLKTAIRTPGGIMRTRLLAILMLTASLFAAGDIKAQQPPAQNPLDVVPDKMPFDLPFGAPIGAERAQAAIAAASGEATKRGWKMNIAVVDWSGQHVAFERMDGAQIASIAISQHKARVAATYRRETKAFENGIQVAGMHYLLTLDDVIASRRGIPLVEGGKIIGAIGCSGSQDEVVAKAGAATVNK